MSRSTQQLLAIVALSVAAGCSDVNVPSGDVVLLEPAFQTIPAGFSANSNSFDASGDAGEAFLPRGFGDGGIRGLLMGGGLGPEFRGLVGVGKGKGRGPFGAFRIPDSCTFSVDTGVVTCPETTKHGLTVNVSYAFKDADGIAQPQFDAASTNSVNVKTTVSGTKAHRHGAATTRVDHSSDRTVVGLAPGQTSRTVNGTAEASETTEGTRDGVEFTATREASDTTTNLVIPIVDGKSTIPSSGVVIRNMKVTIEKEGAEARTKSRREKITFDGTSVVKVEITQDGVTKSCTITLPGRELNCSL